ncbi:PspA/IM30 family protein [Bacillus xiapuensis]|uniref:PspA/IM30 family protein n=1 Tax=Bacillus xiapuensis TaxID=2014075 RepID=UPI000C250475|nr:PspA/IM30 family protein [Bacillus xiapuensis]
MTNIIKRMISTIEAGLFEYVEEKEKKNPIAMLNQYLREAKKETEKAAKLLERQQILKQEFERELREARRLEEKRNRQAEVAAQAGEMELESFARREAEVYKERAERLQESIEAVQEQLITLEKKAEEMKHKLKDMNVRRLELMGRENVARVQHSMNKLLDDTHETARPFGRFEELEIYIDNLENKVNRRYETSLMDVRLAELERRAKQLENNTQQEQSVL